ncbi:MAG TPA: ester cyclase [Thermoanaerobaculia bacterium]|nr:ester cyclase [Thermoanaerobaculia bacterium]HZW75866.1 ester cyclase [Caldimonas sp.]
MSKTNAELARRWFEEVWNQRRDATVHELLAPGAAAHMEGAELVGPEQFLQARVALLDAFPDFRVTVEDIVAEGDDVVVRWSAKGRHAGDGLGMPASRRDASFRGITWMRFAEGQIAEGWDSWNLGKLLQELSAPIE